jgi:nuclear pore complex protein Nup93
LHDTDIEGHLRHAHEQTIISAIEEGRRATTRNFYKTLENKMRKDWERQKELVFEELGRHAPSSSSSGAAGTSGSLVGSSSTGRRSLSGRDNGFGESTSSPSRQQPVSAGSQLQMHTRMMRYDRATRKLNEYRKQGTPLGIVSVFSEAIVGGSSSSDSVRVVTHKKLYREANIVAFKRSAQLAETWRLLAQVVGENNVVDGEFQREALTERQYAKAYLSEDQETAPVKEIRSMITSGALTHLQEQCVKTVTVHIQAAKENLTGS